MTNDTTRIPLFMLRTCYAPVALVAIALVTFSSSVNAEDAFTSVRAKMLEQFDANRDGRLDAAERETMRLVTRERRLKEQSGSGLPADLLADYDTNKDGDMDEGEWNDARISEQVILRKQFDRNNDSELDNEEMNLMMIDIRTVPTRYARDYFAYLIVYDRNKNGEFDGSEYQQAQAAEAEALTATYDANGDGELDRAEKGKIQSDAKNGKIVGFALRFVGEVLSDNKKGKDTRVGGGGYLAEQQELLAFDTNGDGLADPDELSAIRKARAAQLESN